MKWMLIAGLMLVTSGLIAGCGKSTAGQPVADQPPPAALLTADSHWLPDADTIALVKSSSLKDCESRTLEQQVDNYLGSPHWQAGADSRGRDFVNVSGTVTYHGEPTTATFQFLIDQDKRGFKYHAFTINGVLQPAHVASMTLREMCASAKQAPMKTIYLPSATTH